MRETPSDDVILSIRRLLPSLRPAERRVGEVLLADPSGAADETIEQVALRAHTSAATVTRFCRAIDLSGFRQLRTQLAIAAKNRTGIDLQVGSDISESDDLSQVVAKLAFSDAQAIQDTAAQLDLALLSRVIDAVHGARRIDLYGAGASALACLDFQQKLCRLGLVAYAWADTHLARAGAAGLHPGDVAFAFSDSGRTPETLHSLQIAKDHGAYPIAVTSYPRSEITNIATAVLCTTSNEVPLRSAATSSRMAQLTVVDCIFAGLVQHTLSESRAALAATYLATHDEPR